MKKLILISAIAITLLASCSSKPTYVFRSVKTGFQFETDLNYKSGMKVGDTISVYRWPGDPNNYETVDIILVAIK
jgi:hypothetical protein